MKRHLTIAITVTLMFLLSVGPLPVLAAAGEKERANAERHTPVKFVKRLKQEVGVTAKRPEGESTTLLSDGRSLLLGGEGLNGSLNAAEIRDNRTGAITKLAQGMAQKRAWHTATVLPDGKVAVIGGITDKGALADTVEIFDPETLTFSRAAGQVARAYHTATLLTDGRVFIAGGSDGKGGLVKKVEFWSEAKTISLSRASVQDARVKATASIQADGSVLLSAGADESGAAILSAEIYLPESDSLTWVPAKPVDSETGDPRVTFSAPADGTVGVDTTVRIALRFSKPLQSETVSRETVSLIGPGGSVPVKVVAAEKGRLIFVTPLALLKPDRDYHLTIDGAIDTDNQKLAFSSISFKTKLDAKTKEEGTGPQVIDADSWIPGADNFKSNWKSGRANTGTDELPALQAAAGETALAGRVRALSGSPLPNVTLQIGDQIAVTDSTGRFLLSNLTAGRYDLTIQGHTAGRPGKRYGTFDVLVDIAAGKTTVLPYIVWLPVLDDQNAVSLPVPTNREIGVTTPRVPGMEVRIPSDAVLRMPAGAHHTHGLARQELTSMAITPIPADRTPFPLPPGANGGLVFTLQLHGAKVEGLRGEKRPGLRIVYPNYQNLPAGDRVEFWNYDPAGVGWYMYGHGTVTRDRRQIVPDPGVELQSMYCISFMLRLFVPVLWPTLGDDHTDGDPVDLGTGLFVHHQTDLVLPDVIPIELSRTYRQNDSNNRSFGKGAMNPYDMFIYGDTANYGEIILPDGGRVHFDRVPNSNPWVYEHTTSPTRFYKATMKLLTGYGGDYTWEVKLLDGTIFQFKVKVLFGDIFGVHESTNALSLVQDRFGNKLTITRDDNLRMTRVTSPNGRWIDFGYSDTSTRIATATDNSGRVVSYLYDASGRLWKVTDAKGGLTEYIYDSNDRMLTIKDPRNIVYLTNEYDATSGRVTRQTLADTGVYQFTYTVDANGKVTQTDVTDPRGFVRRSTFNTDIYTVSDTMALGRPEQQTYTYQRQTGSNAILSMTDSLGRVTAMTYDSQGNMTGVTRLSGTLEAVSASITYEPTFNQVASITDPLSHTTSFTYDALGNLTGTTDPLNHQTSFTYNSAGQMLTATDALQRTIQFGYDSGDLVSITDPLNHPVSRYVDSAGRVAQITGPLGDVKRFEYDNLNLAAAGTDPAGNVSSLNHDANGNVLSMTDARNSVTSFIYDQMNRVATHRDALLHDETYLYDLNGNLSQVTNRKNQITNFTYDALDRLTQVTYGDSSTTTYTYDAVSRLTQVVDSVSGTITYGYDNLDRLTSETTPQGTVSYTYDLVGRCTSMTVTGQPAVNYTYDNGDRLTQITQGSATVSIAYDEIGRRTSLTLPNGVVTEYGYDLVSHLTSLTYKHGGNVLGNLTYEYDAAGRRTNMGGSFARSLLPQPVASATYNAANQQLTLGGQTFNYDLNGNQTSNGTNSYTWNARNQLAGIIGPQTTASFQYDAGGQRTGTSINGTTTSYLYDGATVVQQQSSQSGTTNTLSGGNGEIFSRSDSTGSWSPLADALGSTLSLTDTAGAVQAEFAYDAFGKSASTNQSIDYPNQFAGNENDGTGLQYNGSDYYDPTSQRFIGENPFAGDNPYPFAGSNPVNGGGQNGPVNYLRDPFSVDNYVLNTGTNTLSDLLLLDKFAEWSWIVGDHCRPTRERILAGAKIIIVGTLIAGSGPIGRGVGRGLGAGARLLGRSGTAIEAALPELEISASKYPELAENISNALNAGHPNVLTHGADAAANRAAALKEIPNIAGLSRDEFPFASSMEGGAGSWVGHIPAAQQSAQGGLITSFTRSNGILPGMQYRVVIGP